MSNQNNLQQLQIQLHAAKIGTAEFSNTYQQIMTLYKAGDIEAGLFLTWALTQRGSLKNFTKKAFELCQEIAKNTRHPAALERMADLLLWGVGLEKDEKQSFETYKQLANQGMLPLTTLAYLYSKGIGTEKDECEASSTLLKAATQGDTLAFMLLSYRYEHGLGVPLNGTIARAYACLAGKREFPGAADRMKILAIRFASIADKKVDILVGKLIHNIEDMYEKTKQLSKTTSQESPEFASRYLELVSKNLSELNIKSLSTNSDIRGYKINKAVKNNFSFTIIRDKPLIVSIKEFACFEECQHLINQALPLLESTADQAKRKTNTEIDAFSGDSAILTSRQNSPVDRMIQQRFAKFQKVAVENFEPISLLKYSVGHEYSTHTDAFEESRIKSHEQVGDFGGQRVSTNLIYLLPPTKGGETHYEDIDLKLSGEVGTAIIHRNCDDTYKPESKSLHTGLKIIEGEKWLLRTATRQFSLYGTQKFDI